MKSIHLGLLTFILCAASGCNDKASSNDAGSDAGKKDSAVTADSTSGNDGTGVDSSGSDGQSDGMNDTAEDAVTTVEEKLALVPIDQNCAQFLYSVAEEKLPRGAIRFTPGKRPFTVEKIQYRLLHADVDLDKDTDIDLSCDANMEHQILLYTGTDKTPPTSANAGQVITVKKDSTNVSRKVVQVIGKTTRDAHEITVTLETPFVIPDSSSSTELYVVFLILNQSLGGAGDTTDSKVTCHHVCLETADTNRDRNYYNFSDPISWQSTFDYVGGADATYQVTVIGSVPK